MFPADDMLLELVCLPRQLKLLSDTHLGLTTFQTNN